jgi:hypothetical protein
MNPLLRLSCFVLALMVFAGGAFANSSLSVDSRAVAWAAYGAAAAGDASQIPMLLAVASQWRTLAARSDAGTNSAELAAQRQDERDAMAAVVDALIQLKATVPAETMRALAPDFGNGVAVLLSRMPEEQREALSFEFYRNTSAGEYGLQYVSAALLALHPVPGFAADLIGNVKVQATVTVVVPGHLGGVGGGSSHCGGSFGESSRNDWPTIGQYALSDERDDGALQLVGGIGPVYAKRFEAMHYRGSFSSISLGSDERVRLIAEMLDISAEDIPWKASVTATIAFESDAQFRDELADFVKAERDEHQKTVAALEARSLLTGAEAQESLPEMEIFLMDFRGEGFGPLPEPMNLPPRVTLMAQDFRVREFHDQGTVEGDR